MPVVLTLRRGLCVSVHSQAFPSRSECIFRRAIGSFARGGSVTLVGAGGDTFSTGSYFISGSGAGVAGTGAIGAGIGGLTLGCG